MADNDDLKWFTKRGTIRTIPNRYRAGVAVIVAALLFYNLFGVLFAPTSLSSGACGSLMRPALDTIDDNGENAGNSIGWPWDVARSFTGEFQEPDTAYPEPTLTALSCPRLINGLFFEFVANFVALWICGWYLRRAMRAEAEEAAPEQPAV